MPRMWSPRPLVLAIMKRELLRIEGVQLKAADKDQPYALSEGDLESVMAAAKVASLLDKVKDPGGEEEKEAAPRESPAEVLRQLEEKVPAQVSRPAGDPDAES